MRTWKRLILSVALVSTSLFPVPSASASEDPFPGISQGQEIPGTKVEGDIAIDCPEGSGRGIEINIAEKKTYTYCVKTWRPQAEIDDEANRRAAEETARAEAEAAAAANPGVQVCKQWSYTYSNGISTASGGVCVTKPVESTPIVGPTSPPSNDDPSTQPSDDTFQDADWRQYEPDLVVGSCGKFATIANIALRVTYTRPFSVEECRVAARDSLVSQTRQEAQAAASAAAAASPGQQVCTSWTALDQSGQECAFVPKSAGVVGNVEITGGTAPTECGTALIVDVSTGIQTTQPLTPEECALRYLDSKASAAAQQARDEASAQAKTDPGTEFCVTWTATTDAGTRTGKECATSPLLLDSTAAGSSSPSAAPTTTETAPNLAPATTDGATNSVTESKSPEPALLAISLREIAAANDSFTASVSALKVETNPVIPAKKGEVKSALENKHEALTSALNDAKTLLEKIFNTIAVVKARS